MAANAQGKPPVPQDETFFRDAISYERDQILDDSTKSQEARLAKLERFRQAVQNRAGEFKAKGFNPEVLLNATYVPQNPAEQFVTGLTMTAGVDRPPGSEPYTFASELGKGVGEGAAAVGGQALGGALGTALFPGLGTLIGSSLGGYGASTAAAYQQIAQEREAQGKTASFQDVIGPAAIQGLPGLVPAIGPALRTVPRIAAAAGHGLLGGATYNIAQNELMPESQQMSPVDAAVYGTAFGGGMAGLGALARRYGPQLQEGIGKVLESQPVDGPPQASAGPKVSPVDPSMFADDIPPQPTPPPGVTQAVVPYAQTPAGLPGAMQLDMLPGDEASYMLRGGVTQDVGPSLPGSVLNEIRALPGGKEVKLKPVPRLAMQQAESLVAQGATPETVVRNTLNPSLEIAARLQQAKNGEKRLQTFIQNADALSEAMQRAYANQGTEQGNKAYVEAVARYMDFIEKQSKAVTKKKRPAARGFIGFGGRPDLNTARDTMSTAPPSSFIGSAYALVDRGFKKVSSAYTRYISQQTGNLPQAFQVQIAGDAATKFYALRDAFVKPVLETLDTYNPSDKVIDKRVFELFADNDLQELYRLTPDGQVLAGNVDLNAYQIPENIHAFVRTLAYSLDQMPDAIGMVYKRKRYAPAVREEGALEDKLSFDVRPDGTVVLKNPPSGDYVDAAFLNRENKVFLYDTDVPFAIKAITHLQRLAKQGAYAPVKGQIGADGKPVYQVIPEAVTFKLALLRDKKLMRRIRDPKAREKYQDVIAKDPVFAEITTPDDVIYNNEKVSRAASHLLDAIAGPRSAEIAKTERLFLELQYRTLLAQSISTVLMNITPVALLDASAANITRSAFEILKPGSKLPKQLQRLGFGGEFQYLLNEYIEGSTTATTRLQPFDLMKKGEDVFRTIEAYAVFLEKAKALDVPVDELLDPGTKYIKTANGLVNARTIRGEVRLEVSKLHGLNLPFNPRPMRSNPIAAQFLFLGLTPLRQSETIANMATSLSKRDKALLLRYFAFKFALEGTQAVISDYDATMLNRMGILPAQAQSFFQEEEQPAIAGGLYGAVERETGVEATALTTPLIRPPSTEAWPLFGLLDKAGAAAFHTMDSMAKNDTDATAEHLATAAGIGASMFMQTIPGTNIAMPKYTITKTAFERVARYLMDEPVNYQQAPYTYNELQANAHNIINGVLGQDVTKQAINVFNNRVTGVSKAWLQEYNSTAPNLEAEVITARETPSEYTEALSLWLLENKREALEHLYDSYRPYIAEGIPQPLDDPERPYRELALRIASKMTNRQLTGYDLAKRKLERAIRLDEDVTQSVMDAYNADVPTRVIDRAIEEEGR